ncbi:MAG: hypothetical protein IJJ23_03535 [Clostridia bacterium]|nr:hypothetical protein [Clostridia bacterium]
MTAKEYLSQAYRLDQRIERKIEDRDRMRAKLQKATAQITGMPRGGSGVDWTELSVRAMEYDAKIAREMSELYRLKTEIEGVIAAVEDQRYQRLLTLRYIDGKRWENIAVEMSYSWRRVMQMHHEALRAVIVPESLH